MSKEFKHPCQESEHKKNDHSVSRRNFVTAVGAATAGLVATACTRGSNPLDSSTDGPLNQPVNPPSGSPSTQQDDDKVPVALNDINNY